MRRTIVNMCMLAARCEQYFDGSGCGSGSSCVHGDESNLTLLQPQPAAATAATATATKLLVTESSETIMLSDLPKMRLLLG